MVCVAFVHSRPAVATSSFLTGFKNFCHVSQLVAQNEASRTPSKHAQEYLRATNDDIFSV